MFRKLSIIVILALVLAAGGFTPVYAQEVEPVDPVFPVPSVDPEGIVDETPEYWFVELTGNPTIEGASLSVTRAEKKAFREAARRAGIKYTERMAFDTLWNGLSIKIDKSELNGLVKLPMVKAIYPVDVIPMPVPFEGQYNPELYTALAMTGADIAQSELGYTGEGVKVAVMDTGIDYDHPDLGGCFGPGCRVAYGYDLVGDAFNADPAAATYNPVPVPDPDPDDCGGHGTHVSGIIGANGDVVGVAPEVTFGAYRVFGCEGSTTADIMLAAMEMALADDMDILNMSIGSAYQWPQYPTAVAADRLVNKGMVVVASIGNNGANGLYSAGAPGLGKKVIGVAAFDNTDVFLPYFTVNDLPVGYIAMTFSPPIPTSGTFEMVDVGLACSALPAGSATGKVALAARGTCAFSVKAINAIAAGAEAVVISNNAAGIFNGTLGAPLPDPRPVVGISMEAGAAIRAMPAPWIFEWTDLMASFSSPTGDLISSFSSYGLSPDLALKPDIGAPGGNIYSTYPLEKGGYTTMGGTSMSSPHVAGAVALLLQANPKLPAAAVRDVLQNSADPHVWWGNPALGLLDNVHRQGAGMLDIDDAILATTLITPAKIATGESEAGPFTQTLTLKNSGYADVTYTLSSVGALSTGPNTFTPSFFTGFATVAFSAPTVMVPAGGYATVDVTITAHPALPDKSQYGGYIVFTPTTPGQSYSVPFGGFKGDYQSIQVLAPTAYGFPWLALLYGGNYYKLTDPSDWTFTMVGTDIPFFLLHLDHQSRSLKMEVFSASGKAYHTFAVEEYLPRNSGSTGFFSFGFDGYTFAGKKVYMVPDGTYYVKVTVLKANGDASNPAHWEEWTSPMFVIDRP